MIFFSTFGFIFIFLVSWCLYQKKIIAPGLFFLINFSFGFLIFSASNFIEHDLSARTYIILLISFFCFIIGNLFAKVTVIKQNYATVAYKTVEDMSARDFKIITVLYVLFLIGALYSVYFYISHLGLMNYFTNIVSINSNEIPVDSTLMLYLKKIGQVLAIYATYCLLAYNKKKIYYLFIIITLVALNISYQRNELFYIVGLIAITYMYMHQSKASTSAERKKRGKTIFVIAIILLAALMFFVRTQKDFGKTAQFEGKLFGKHVSNTLITPISYYIGPFASTSKYLDNIQDTPFMMYTGRFVYDILSRLGLCDISSFQYGVPFVSIPFSFNTATMQYYIFSEGGYLWLSIFYILIGYLSYKWYKNYLETKDLLPLIKLVYISFMLLFSIREYALMRIDYLIVFIAYEYISYKRKVQFRIPYRKQTIRFEVE